MLKKFRNRALRDGWGKDDWRGVDPARRERIAMILDALDTAKRPGDMNLPGLRFHPLKGSERGRYAVTVTGNVRITFAFDGEDATQVDLEDYH